MKQTQDSDPMARQTATTRRVRYHDLVGMRVITADGHDVGRVADLRAEPVGEALRVTHLLVGERVLIRRIAQSIAAREVPWSLVRGVGRRVDLRVTLAELAAALEGDVG